MRRVAIQSGNIGLHDDSKKKGEIKIKKDVVFIDSDSSVVANKIKIEKDAIAPNVYYNELDNKGEILGTENTPLVLPIVNNLPEFPDFESGDKKIKVDKKNPISLPPGDYGKIELKKLKVKGKTKITGDLDRLEFEGAKLELALGFTVDI